MQRRVQIGGSVVVQAGGDSDPAAGAQRQQRVADAQMRIPVRQAAFPFHRQIDILDPVPFGLKLAARCLKAQGEPVGTHDLQLLPYPLHPWREPAGRHADVMVAGVDQQTDPQSQIPVGVNGFESIRDINCIGPRLQPDALFDRCLLYTSDAADE